MSRGQYRAGRSDNETETPNGAPVTLSYPYRCVIPVDRLRDALRSSLLVSGRRRVVTMQRDRVERDALFVHTGLVTAPRLQSLVGGRCPRTTRVEPSLASSVVFVSLGDSHRSVSAAVEQERRVAWRTVPLFSGTPLNRRSSAAGHVPYSGLGLRSLIVVIV